MGMSQTPSSVRSSRCVFVARAATLAAVLALFPLASCGTSKSARTDPMPDWAENSEFGFSAQAVDPSAADKAAGYGRWKQKPETEGTIDPKAPVRRSHGWGAANNGIE